MFNLRFQRYFLFFIGITLTGLGPAYSSPLKVGLVLDKGGKDDKSFNASAFRGALEAKNNLGIHLKVLECSTDSAFVPSLMKFATHGYDLIIGIGFVQKSALEKVAQLFPQTHFLLVDAPSELPNVRSALFEEHEGSYVVGTIAALTSQSHKVGFIGGMDIPLIRRFELGYRKGAEQGGSLPTTVITHYVGSSSDAWRNPARAKELALFQFSKGVDIIFCAAGSSCMGVFDAAHDKHKLAIGVDSNQNSVKPGTILTSMVKGVDKAVYQAIADKNKKQFTGGIQRWGIKEEAIIFSEDEHNKTVLKSPVRDRAKAIEKAIMAKQIQVPDYYSINSGSFPSK